MEDQTVDVVVVGAGNAAMGAALSAHEHGLSVVVLERAPRHERGGNSHYTGGAMRVSHEGVDDLVKLMPDMSESEIRDSDFGRYPADTFFDDLATVSQYRADPELAHLLATESFSTLLWMKEQGIRFLPQFGRQAFKHTVYPMGPTAFDDFVDGFLTPSIDMQIRIARKTAVASPGSDR